MNDTFYKSILDNIEDIIVVRDKNGTVIYSNSANTFTDGLVFNGNDMFKSNDIFYQRSTKKIGNEFVIERYADVTKLNEIIYKYGIDHLTKLPIRVKIDEYLQAISKTRRHYVFAMVDIDDFKSVNDTHGHDMGDVVLSEVGKVIYTNKRYDDFAGRYGGEEFLLVFEAESKYQLLSKIDYIREKVKSLEFNQNGKYFNVTISVGLSDFNPAFDVIDDKIKEADQALYNVKESGKDAVGTIDSTERKFVKYYKFP